MRINRERFYAVLGLVACPLMLTNASAQAASPFAQETDGSQYYVKGFAGASFEDNNTTLRGNGTAFGGGFGIRTAHKVFGIFRPRFELEGSYVASNTPDSFTETVNSDGGPISATNLFSGDQSITSITLNAYGDLVWNENQRLYPYIGGGLGIGFTDIEIVTSLQGGPPATTSILDGDDTVFVGHVTTGLTYRASNKVDFYSEARYFRAFDVTISQSTPFFPGDDEPVGRFSDDREDFIIAAGIRFRF